MSDYKYGVYPKLGDTVALRVAPSPTNICYIGTAPVHLIRNYRDAVNMPLVLRSESDLRRLAGYSPDWGSFTLCEAMDCHFTNPLGAVGPIIVINVLDPDRHRKDAPTEITLRFVNRRAVIPGDRIILDTLALENLAENADYTLRYDFDRQEAVIDSIAEPPIEGDIAASYYEVDAGRVTAADVIGSEVQGVCTGIHALQYIYPMRGIKTNVALAPGWSHIKEVHDALVEVTRGLNSYWLATAIVDIPLMDGSAPIREESAAARWKKNSGYDSEFVKCCWPQAKVGGNVYHLSTQVAYAKMACDIENDGIPIRSPGNRPSAITELYFGEDAKRRVFDRRHGNALCEQGITTAIAQEGGWVIWGDHMEAYDIEGGHDPRATYDTRVYMLDYVLNGFVERNMQYIDQPLTRGLVDAIVNSEQIVLDNLVGRGALVGQPVISFVDETNPLTELMEGRFRFDVPISPASPVKAITVSVAFDQNGYKVYWEGGETE